MRKLLLVIFVLISFRLATGAAYAALPPIQNTIQTIIGNGGTAATTTSFSCPSGDYATCLKTQFGATVNGSPTTTTLKIVYDGLAKGFNKFPKAAPLFKSMTPRYTFSSAYTGTGGAWALTETNGDQTYYGAFFGPNSSARYRQYIIVHESGHVVADAKNSLQTTLYNNVHNAGLDRSCFNSSGVIKTYPLNLLNRRFPSGIPLWSKIAETWGDSYSNSVVCGSGDCPSNGGGGQSISNFPNTCKNTYNYMTGHLGL